RGNRCGTAVWPVLRHLGRHRAEASSTMCLEGMPGRVAHNRTNQGLTYIEFDTGWDTEKCRETQHFPGVSQTIVCKSISEQLSPGRSLFFSRLLSEPHYARRHRFTVARFVEARLSSRRARQRDQIFQTIEALPAGDRLVVSELSRLGRSLGQIIQAVDQL